MSYTSIESTSSTGCSGGRSAPVARIPIPDSGLDPPDQFDPDPIRIAGERELVAILAERLYLRACAFRDDFFERSTDIGDPEREVVQLLAFAISREKLALGGIPVELQSLCRGGTLQLDPHATVVHPPPPRDLHSHHLPVKLDRAFEVSHPDSGVEVLRENSPFPNGRRLVLTVMAEGVSNQVSLGTRQVTHPWTNSFTGGTSSRVSRSQA